MIQHDENSLIEEDMDLDNDESFIEAVNNLETTKKEKVVDLIDNSLEETCGLETLSMIEKPNLKRKRAGEDVFAKESVKTWQASRIKAWEARRVNPEAYYFRLVVPGYGQRNGGWSSSEHQLFMERYKEWISKGWKIGTAWGLFSIAIPHRVGYQCMNYYRKLVLDKRLEDSSYTVVDGKLKHVQKERSASGTPTADDSAEWETEAVKEIEKNVNQWIKDFHNRSQPTVKSRPVAKPKPKAIISGRTNISDLVKKMPRKKPVTGDEDDFQMDTADPEVAHLEQRDWDAEWKERLDMYKDFLKLYCDKEKRHASWLAKQEWRRGLLTTEMLMRKNMVQKSSTLPPIKSNNNKAVQSTLSRFFTGVKKQKVDTPDELISFVRIPNDLYSGVKQIQQLSKRLTPDTSKLHYFEIDDMNHCIPTLDQLTKENNLEGISPLEGILVDPPWEFYVADGRNDGACSWNISDFQKLMEKVVGHMSAGLVFVWTHKLIQADLVRMMYTIDCKYVENLVWFKKSVNNVHLDNPSPYISSTKEILLMFKKGEGVELRHQRSPDVIIDFEVPTDQWISHEYTEPKPPAVYDMIETLLPKAGYNDTLNRGRFLELWAKKGLPRREGWIAFHENKTKPMLIDEP
ncbi:unnamed protein product [Rhizopus stolonifer]